MKAATLRSSCLLLWLLLHCTDSRSHGRAEFSLAGKSVYFIVIDRFARSGEQAANFTFCDLPADWVNNTGGGFCGGTINGITNHLDYIQGMGFDCLWITPPVQSQGFMGYDATNLFQINPHFGTKEDLVRLSAALHGRGMCLIVDIVLNHMRPLLVNGTVNLSSIVPFSEESHYHQRNRSRNQSFADYVAAWPPPAFNPGEDNAQLLAASQQHSPAVCGHTVADHTECSCFPGNSGPNCPSFREDHLSTGWLGVMGDLNQSHEYVRAQLLSFVEGMVVNYSLDALRLDTAIYLERDFLPEIQAVHQELVLRLDVESDIMARNSVKPLSRKIDCSDELCGAGYQSFFDVMAWFRLRAQQAVAGVEILGEATVNNLTYQAGLMQ
ncbi:amyB, partial [Symbiodinium necroappetens]